VYQPWNDHLTFTATLSAGGAAFTLNETLTQLRGTRRDVGRVLNIVTSGTTPELAIPVSLEGGQALLAGYHEAAARWFRERQEHDLLHHRPVLIVHSGGRYATGHGRRLSQGEQQAVRHGTFTPPGMVLAPFLPRLQLDSRPDLDLEEPGDNDTTESGDRLRFIRPAHAPRTP